MGLSSNLFSRLFRRTAAEDYRLPPGLRVYAIGDVHGRLDRLLAVEEAVRAHAAANRHDGQSIAIFVGDYVDRGPDSRGVIDHLEPRRFAGLEARFLMGNHEDAMLVFLEDAAIGPSWCDYGGLATLASYGVRPEGAIDAGRFERLRQGLQTVLPEGHRRFLKDLELSIQLGDYLFVHAGVRPSRALADQRRDDLLTIREPFLSHPGRLPWRVVHGHTISDRLTIGESRIGIDTGAFATGILSCVVIKDADATPLIL